MSSVINLYRSEPMREFDKLQNMLVDTTLSTLAASCPVGTDSYMICIEKYYVRNNNFAALTLVIENSAQGSKAKIIGFGGGGGVLNFDYGANSNYAKKCAEILVKFFDFKIA